MGCSMYLLVKWAKTIVRMMQNIRSRIRNGRPRALLGKTNAGQCHRYNGYEIAPSHWDIRLLLRSLKARGQMEIDPISTAVETTGSNALMPGNAVFSSNLRLATTIPITPNHGMNLFFQKVSGTNRSSAPKPSSQALVGRE